ncbi:hypothetical protein P5V15_014476 [Pogonomyrmex californicus]
MMRAKRPSNLPRESLLIDPRDTSRLIDPTGFRPGLSGVKFFPRFTGLAPVLNPPEEHVSGGREGYNTPGVSLHSIMCRNLHAVMSPRSFLRSSYSRDSRETSTSSHR